ncbi:hypothetical protein V494_08494 [Pseudogymnoascus sp. VKM F-4513 (FW-928)]|nr:hypothetical protein V494_08494 [Pseudogymnoascus sp. VKM F-4513 (FW-928)]
MKSIPSLVASSTVGVAVTGLAFGQPQTPGTSRPSSNKRKATEYDAQHRSYSSPPVRPATSSVINTPRNGQLSVSSPIQPSSYPSNRYINNTFIANDSPINNTRRIGSLSRLGERTSTPEQGGEDRLDSISSKGSWMRRLSVIPNSQNGSPRSSIGPDSPSLFSHGSSGPILHNGSSPSQVQPNKLVKRSTSIRGPSGNTPSRPPSNQRIPTLRRPATSHQRSVTLQQQYRDDESGTEPSPLQEEFPVTLIHEFAPTPRRVSWRPYFTSRRTRLAKERPSTAINDNNTDGFYATFKRVVTPDGSALPTLMKPSLIEDPTKADRIRNRDSVMSIDSGSPHPGNDSGIHSSDYETHKRPRQSISLNFGSPATWITKSNSVRLTKNRDAGRGTGRRNISAPLSSVLDRATSSQGPSHDTFDSSPYQQRTEVSPKNFQGTMPRPRTRNTSSPLPTISRLSSFNLDMNGSDQTPNSGARLRTPTSQASSDGIRTTSRPSSSGKFKGLSSHPVVLHQLHPPRLPELNTSDQASTLVGSDSDAKAFASGEEDETDFQSDTAYDSLRTGATASLRARSTPLDSMFDESPPSSGARSKTADFNDMGAMSGFRNVDDSIVEEDEGMSTPIRSRRRLNGDIYSTPVRQDSDMDMDAVVRSSPPSFCLATTEFGRMSLGDDDDDEDWTRDDDSEALSNPLSPPSNSLNSLRVSHALRSALMDVTESGSSARNGRQPESRPRSVFDWSEPLMQEKVDNMGNSPRPKTVHGKQGNDSRGGRQVGRNRPSALHIRSQSVPVVPDVGGNRDTKLAPKFGTWGLGGKGVSEDWDNDFEFDGMDIDEGDDLPAIGNNAPMLVPPAIRASQANVVGHVGQIREVCLLVEDLKRLRGLAREKGLLEGPSADKWREAEGIIALAIPDEEDETLSPPQSPLATIISRDGAHQDHGTTVNIDSTRDSGFQDEEDDKPVPSAGVYGITRPRRKSVFSPEDDIFGSSLPGASFEEADAPGTAPRRQASKDTSDVARSVMQNIHQHRATSDPIFTSAPSGTPSKMPFDTTSLKDLVQRANALARALSEIIRKADGTTQSPYRSPHLNHDSSPAFTRVFTDPHASPSNINRSQSSNAVLNTTIDSSPTRNLGQRMQMMTVV